jgi:hypothetical protein
MASFNPSTDITTYIQTIYEDAMLVARDNNVMRGLVKTYGDRQGLAARSNSNYGTATINQINELDDLASQALTPSVAQTLTPYEYGAQFFLPDSRIESDPNDLRSDASTELGAAFGQKLDTLLASVFSGFTAGTAGAAGSNMTWAIFFTAMTQLRRALAPRPWVSVLTPEQWHCMGTAIAPGVTVTNSPMIQDEFMRQFFVANVAGVDIFTTANVAVGTSVFGGMFSRGLAVALDIRRAPRLEPDRDPSRRGIELNLSSVFAYGKWKPEYGVAINTAGTAPA